MRYSTKSDQPQPSPVPSSRERTPRPFDAVCGPEHQCQHGPLSPTLSPSELAVSHRYGGWTPGPFGGTAENGRNPCVFGLRTLRSGGRNTIEAVAKDLLQNAVFLGFLCPPVSSQKDMGHCQLPWGEGRDEGEQAVRR